MFKKALHYLKIFLITGPLLYSAVSHAYCTVSGSGLLNFPTTISIGRDLPIGSTLASAKINTAVSCSRPGLAYYDGSWRTYPSKSNQDYGASSVTNVRNTTTPGVGIRWENYSSATATTATWTQYQLNNLPVGIGRGLPTPPDGTSQTTTFTDTVYLVKTGPITSSTMNPITLLMDYEGSASYIQGGFLYSLKTATTPTFQINTCTVNSSALNIKLPTINNNALRSTGDTAGNTMFNIPLNCPTSTKLYITFTDNINPGQTGNILSLQPDSTASGLALQIKQNGTAISFGPDSNILNNINQLLLGNIVGSISLPFSVNYIRTANGPLIPGTLTAIASFTFSYQ